MKYRKIEPLTIIRIEWTLYIFKLRVNYLIKDSIDYNIVKLFSDETYQLCKVWNLSYSS